MCAPDFFKQLTALIYINISVHIPVEQLQGHGVSIVVRHQVHSLIDQTQVGHQGLHHAGLLENRVLVGSLDWKKKQRRMWEI